MERCKLKHSLAFFQFRKLLPKAKLHDLMPLFNGRKNFLLEIMGTFKEQIKINEVQKVIDTASKVLPIDDIEIDGHGCHCHFERNLFCESFEEMGMTDPFNQPKSMLDSISEVRTFDFYTTVYPKSLTKEMIEAIKGKKQIDPPKCVFLPTQEIIRTMVRALIRFGNDENSVTFFDRFGLLDI